MRKFIQFTPQERKGWRRYDGRYNHILDFIIHYKENNDGAGPTIREIGVGCGISSTSVVNYAVNRLLDSGLIYLTPKGHIGVRGGKWSYEKQDLPEIVVNAKTTADDKCTCVAGDDAPPEFHEPSCPVAHKRLLTWGVANDQPPFELVAAGLERREE